MKFMLFMLCLLMQIFLGEFVQVALWLVLLLHLVKIDEPSKVYFECGTCIQLQ